MARHADKKHLLKPGNRFLCEEFNPDMSRAKGLRRTLPGDEAFHDAARMMKACADTSRAKILYALAESELCVCELACLLKLSMPTVSHHLRLLNNAKLIRYRKDGKLVFYSLRNERLNGTVRRLVDSFNQK